MNSDGSDQQRVEVLGSDATNPASPQRHAHRIPIEAWRDQWNIYVVGPEPGAIHRVSTGSSNNQRAAWVAPTATTSPSRSNRDGKTDIYIAAADGSARVAADHQPGQQRLASLVC